MICEADPNGHGYISYTAFENIISSFKEYKEETVISPIDTFQLSQGRPLMKF